MTFLGQKDLQPIRPTDPSAGCQKDLDLENRVLDLAGRSLSDHRWGVIIGQPMRHLLSEMFQQQINSATRINSSTTYVRKLG